MACALLAACSDSSDDVVKDCTSRPDFTQCVAAADADGICLLGACEALTPCGAAGCTDHRPRFPLADTSVRECFGPSPRAGQDGRISCPGKAGSAACASTDHCGQDGQYGWDVEHKAAERFTVSTAPADQRVVTDNVTGLKWQRCAGGQTGADCKGAASLQDWSRARTHCEQSSWAGHTDWRLPDNHELHSLLDFSTTSPALDRSVFSNAPSKFSDEYEQWWRECYWTATTYAGDSKVAWVAMVNSGDMSEGSGTPYHLNTKDLSTKDGKKWEGCYVRCVRGSRAATKHERFVRLDAVADQPTVADTETHLIWQGCSAGQKGSVCSGAAAMKPWKASLSHCEGLTWAGKSDWRLPSVKELRSLVDTSRRSPAIDDAMFPNTPYYGAKLTAQNAGQFWSATARWYNDFALYVDFRSGFSHFYKQPEGRHVRCVRDPG